MTTSHSHSHTWSRTDARYVAGKVAADLRQMQQEYGDPSDDWIEAYLLELTILLAGRFVDTVSYGYRRDGDWVAALKYTADIHGNLVADDRSGRVPRGANISGASWYSFLSYSDAWSVLSPEERETIRRELPFRRSTGTEPGVASGTWVHDKTYSSVGSGMRRATVGGRL